MNSFPADSDLPVETWIEHNSMNLITVDGYQAPIYYTREIVYDTDLGGLTEVIERSVSCQQEILYKCNNSRLMVQADVGGKYLHIFIFDIIKDKKTGLGVGVGLVGNEESL